MASPNDPLVITADRKLLDQVQSCAAVAGVSPTLADGTVELSRNWSSSPLVLVGVDQAQRVTEQLPSRRGETVLLGHDDQTEALCRWSQPLGASILSLPEGIGWLTTLFGSDPEPGSGRLLALVGGCGGIGTSTLAVGMAQRLHSARGAVGEAAGPVAVVDVDPGSGGIDLVLGVESVPGRRWSHFAAAHGHLRGLLDELPGRDRVKVLSADPRSPEPNPSAVTAVLRAAGEEAAASLVDLGRGGGAVSESVIRLASEVWLVVGNDIASIAAARRTRIRLPAAAVRLVVRRHRWGELSADQVAELVGVPLVGAVPTDQRIARGVDQGMGPVAVAGRRWIRAVDALVGQWWSAA
ncbi:septum site-determining protein Ssd [Naumannella halotolerans]|uniref:septum site-determining protein Ssd n=1 Tax=Naumannella halotolerans TaxID=993414 RepID=UPI00370DBFF1